MIIRPYAPGDRDAVGEICLSTGLRGHVADLFADIALFLDMWMAPYLSDLTLRR